VTTADEPRPADARLVPAAVCCWGIDLLGLRAGWGAACWSAALLSMLGGVGAVWLRARRPRGRAAAALRGATAAALLAAGLAAALAVRLHAIADHPLTRLHDGARLIADVVVTDDPKLLTGKVFSGGPQVLVRATVTGIRYGGTATRLGGKVVILAPAARWAGVLPGQRAVVRAVLNRPLGHDPTVLATLRVTMAPRLVGGPPWWQRAAGTIRHRLAAAVGRALPPDMAGLLPALVIGDTTREPQHVVADFKGAGLTHLTAVSGENLTVLTNAVMFFTTRATLGRRATTAATVLAILGFVVLARPSPSVLRAAVMGAVGVLAQATGRTAAALPALCGAIVLLLGLFPALAEDLGFALSCAATAGLVVLSPDWERRLRARGWRRKPAEILAVACAAFVMTMPLVVAVSGRLSPISIVANALVHVAIAYLTMTGLLVAALALVWTPLGAVVAYATVPGLWWLLMVARWAGGVPGGSMAVPGGLPGAGLACVVLAVGGLVAPILARVVRRRP
jgi:competence protein ComEC